MNESEELRNDPSKRFETKIKVWDQTQRLSQFEPGINVWVTVWVRSQFQTITTLQKKTQIISWHKVNQTPC